MEDEAAERGDRTGGGTQERVDPHEVCSARGSVALKPWGFSQSMTDVRGGGERHGDRTYFMPSVVVYCARGGQ